ncbi:MAG: hypothetical protein ACP5HJ_00555 [Candidatus Micrarchaeia archaeon]
MKKFLLFLSLLMLVTAQTQQQPASCIVFRTGITYFYSDQKCSSDSVLFTCSYQPPSDIGNLYGECLSISNPICEDAFKLCSAQQTQKPQSVKFLSGLSTTGIGNEQPFVIAVFYSTTDCNTPISVAFVNIPIGKAQNIPGGQICETGVCYSSDTACFQEATKQVSGGGEKRINFCSQSAVPLQFQSLSLLALLFTFTLLGLLYSIGEITSSSSIKAFVKSEYFEGIKSIILFVGIFSILATMNSLLLPLTGEKDLINGACNKALEIKGTPTTGGIEKIQQEVFNYAFQLGVFAPLTLSFGFGINLGKILGVSINSMGTFLPSSIIEWAYPPTKFTLINYVINDVVYGIENSFLIAIARVAILTLTPIFVYQFLLPIGLFFRGFPILRKIGGFFIALSIGLLIIYPSLVLFFDYPFLKTVINAVQPTSPILQQISQLSLPIEVNLPIFGKVKINILSIFLPFLVSSIPASIISIISIVDIGAVLFPSIISLYLPLNYFLSAVSVNLAQMVVVFIDLLIMYTLILDLSDIIGGKLKIAGREVQGFGFLKL